MSKSVFGVKYNDPDRSDCFCSVDWWGEKRGGWVPVSKSIGGSEWYPENSGKSGQLAYEAILKKFHLEKLAKELPMEKVQTMSPAALVRYREKNRLPAIDVFTDATTVNPNRAEEYE
ncbi:MAG: hypothetical protein Q7R84_03015 [bacterium]|nr:hypothetical protein [bacterium]